MSGEGMVSGAAGDVVHCRVEVAGKSVKSGHGEHEDAVAWQPLTLRTDDAADIRANATSEIVEDLSECIGHVVGELA
jgi:hypothetical protein